MSSSEIVRCDSIFPLARLPDEILRLVLAALRDISLGDFAPALRATRSWNDLGRDMLWRHLVLLGSRLPRFIVCMEKLPSRDILCRNIQSLTLGTQKSTPLARYNAEADKSLHRLSMLLPSMTNLHTFSFEHHNDPLDPWGSVSPKIDQIVVLVRSLPLSVRNLEINAYSTYRSFQSQDGAEDTCICSALSAKIPTLKSLRLVLPQLCSKLFDQSSSTLEHLIINACKPDMQPFVQECYLADIQRSLSWDDVQAQKATKSKNTIQMLLRCVREPSFTATVLPNLRRLQIIEPYRFATVETPDRWHLINVHSFTRGESAPSDGIFFTHSHPIWPTGYVDGDAADPYHFILRRCLHKTNSVEMNDPTHVCADLDVASYGNAICQQLEGMAGWTTTSSASRQPRYSQIASQSSCFSHKEFSTRPGWSETYRTRRSEWIENYIAEHRLWYDPDVAKCTNLAQMQSFQRLYGVKPVEAGADYIWYLEDKQRKNLLVARVFEGGFPDTPFDIDKHEFCSDIELVRKAQEDPLDYDLLQPHDENLPYPWNFA